MELYAGLQGPVIRTGLETAEMVKYADNAWHALKVGFANEIGIICKPLGIDSHEVMDIFCQDTKLNISPYYLQARLRFRRLVPAQGRARAAYKAKTLDVEVPILELDPAQQRRAGRARRSTW